MAGKSNPETASDRTAFDEIIAAVREASKESDMADAPSAREKASPDEPGLRGKISSIADLIAREARLAQSLLAKGGPLADGVRSEIKSHPFAAVSGGFAVGYMIGKAVVRRMRK